jgi:hypothetical protein
MKRRQEEEENSLKEEILRNSANIITFNVSPLFERRVHLNEPQKMEMKEKH